MAAARQLPARGGQKPHITVLATLETLRRDPGAPAALLDRGLPLSGKALRKIATDAELTPILLSKDGDPLHVGRKHRTATPKMRRALAARDRKCVWPRCPNSPDFCQGDHVTPWARGGKTEVEAMRLLCTDHHVRLSQGWSLERQSDGTVVVHPPPPQEPLFGPAVYEPPAHSKSLL